MRFYFLDAFLSSLLLNHFQFLYSLPPMSALHATQW